MGCMSNMIQYHDIGKKGVNLEMRPWLTLPTFTNILKLVLQSAKNQLVLLFDRYLVMAKVPKEWKGATIIAIYKGGDRISVSNYRPISLLALPGKILERLL